MCVMRVSNRNFPEKVMMCKWNPATFDEPIDKIVHSKLDKNAGTKARWEETLTFSGVAFSYC